MAALSPVQRPEADVNIEFQADSKFAGASRDLAFALQAANEKYATDYPANIGSHMSNTDSHEFQDVVASISVRENERGAQVGAGWDPQWHQPTDLYATYDDKDFRLGLNAAQTTLSAVARLAGAEHQITVRNSIRSHSIRPERPAEEVVRLLISASRERPACWASRPV